MFAQAVCHRVRIPILFRYPLTDPSQVLPLLGLAATVAAQVTLTTYPNSASCSGTSSKVVAASKKCVDFPAQASSFSYTGGNAELQAVIYSG